MNKKLCLLNLVIKNTENRLEMLFNSALEAHDAATNTESKAENKYDTRGLEASYLAGAQSKRVKELEESLFYLKKVKEADLVTKNNVELYSIVKIEDEDGVVKSVFILPVQGGVVIEFNNKKYQIITLSSPLGKSMFNKKVEEEFIVIISGEKKYFEILQVD